MRLRTAIARGLVSGTVTDDGISVRCHKCSKRRVLSVEYNIKEIEEYICGKCKSAEKYSDNDSVEYLFRRISRDAKRRGLSFTLTKEWVAAAIIDRCHYCNRPGTNVLKRKFGNFSYNGLDRKNNNVGYTEKNCVTCCFVCNRAKQEMTYKEFISWIDDMVQYRSESNRL